jgi:hypothetical protein
MNRVCGLRRLIIDRHADARTLAAGVAAKHQRGAIVGTTDDFGAMASALRARRRMGLSDGSYRVRMNHNVI